MVILDLINFGAGAYKGYMNAGGNEVGSEYLVATVALTSMLKGVRTYFHVKQMDDSPRMQAAIELREKRTGKKVEFPSPQRTAIQKGGISLPISALEVMVGYGIGYAAYKVMN